MAGCSRRAAAVRRIVLISEDLDELLRLSDRVAVMHRGQLSADHADLGRHRARARPADDRTGAPCGLSRAPIRRAGWSAGAPVAAIVAGAGAGRGAAGAGRRRPRAAPTGRWPWRASARWFALSETLTRATPLILTGLAVAVAFRARLWNIGAEGQLYLGAVAAVALGSGAVHAAGRPAAAARAGRRRRSPGPVHAGADLLKVRLGVDEVVTTLLLNFVALLLVGCCSRVRCRTR